MKKKTKTNKDIACKIIESIKKHSSPGQSTWGDKYPDAHEELFGKYSGYFGDLVEDVNKVLSK